MCSVWAAAASVTACSTVHTAQPLARSGRTRSRQPTHCRSRAGMRRGRAVTGRGEKQRRRKRSVRRPRPLTCLLLLLLPPLLARAATATTAAVRLIRPHTAPSSPQAAQVRPLTLTLLLVLLLVVLAVAVEQLVAGSGSTRSASSAARPATWPGTVPAATTACSCVEEPATGAAPISTRPNTAPPHPHPHPHCHYHYQHSSRPQEQQQQQQERQWQRRRTRQQQLQCRPDCLCSSSACRTWSSSCGPRREAAPVDRRAVAHAHMQPTRVTERSVRRQRSECAGAGADTPDMCHISNV